MLQDITFRKAKPREKPYKMADERGLYLLVNPNGSKLWRFDYRHQGKRKTLSIGLYPDVPLADARTRRDEARQLLAQGIDPMAQKKAVKAADTERAANGFEAIAREWLAKTGPTWSAITLEHAKQRLEHDLFPDLGSRPIAEITARELLAVLNKIVDRGDAAHGRPGAGGCFPSV